MGSKGRHDFSNGNLFNKKHNKSPILDTRNQLMSAQIIDIPPKCLNNSSLVMTSSSSTHSMATAINPLVSNTSAPVVSTETSAPLFGNDQAIIDLDNFFMSENYLG